MILAGAGIIGSQEFTGEISEFNVTVSQVGPNVVWGGSGSFNTTDLAFDGTQNINAVFEATNATWVIGDPTPPGPALDVYTTVTTFPPNFGTPGGLIGTPGGSGETFGIFLKDGNRVLVVPTGYVSGSPVSGSTTYAGTTIAGMNLIPSAYTYSWGSGSITLTIG